MADPIKWSKQLLAIYNNQSARCPLCGAEITAAVHCGSDRIGYAILTCSKCKQSVTLSRIKVPQTYKAIIPLAD